MSAALRPNKDPERRCLPLDLWPKADRQAWAAALCHGDVLDPGGPGSKWAAVTRAGVIKGYGRWLTWLDRTGRLDLARPMTEQVTPQAVKAFIEALREINAPKTVVHRIVCLAQAAGAMAPATDWSWLWRIAGRLQRTAVAVRSKHSRLVGSDELFALGLQLMKQAEQGRDLAAWRYAIQYRDGLIIALLAARPLRLKNFAALEIGRHLVPHGEHHRLLFPKAEMKNRQALELSFPEQLVPYLERYLSHHRPRLSERAQPRDGCIRPPCARLWLSKTGVALTVGVIYDHIVSLTRARFGRSVPPHLFRDCAATSIARRDPEHVRITMSVLGHTRMATSERTYNHARSLEATRQYQGRILALRRQP